MQINRALILNYQMKINLYKFYTKNCLKKPTILFDTSNSSISPNVFIFDPKVEHINTAFLAPNLENFILSFHRQITDYNAEQYTPASVRFTLGCFR